MGLDMISKFFYECLQVCATLEDVYILVAPLDTWSMDDMERQRRARYQKSRGDGRIVVVSGHTLKRLEVAKVQRKNKRIRLIFMVVVRGSS